MTDDEDRGWDGLTDAQARRVASYGLVLCLLAAAWCFALWDAGWFG